VTKERWGLVASAVLVLAAAALFAFLPFAGRGTGEWFREWPRENSVR
jgi:hypothetical protein